MKPIDQTYFVGDDSGRLGNCWQAALASILEFPLDEVPHFAEETDPWQFFVEYLESLGYSADWGMQPPAWYSLALGKSPRGDFNHIVVVHNGNMIHDPHPSRAGIENVYFSAGRIMQGNLYYFWA